MQKFIVYMTLNVVNRKIYIGVHKTDPTTFDGYIGCDVWHWSHKKLKNPITTFHRAVAKYGYDKFERITLGVFNTAEEAYYQESIIVNKEFVARRDVYNMALGGANSRTYTKTILQYSIDGKFLKVWDSIVEASEYYNKHSNGSITNCLVGNSKSALGFQWRYFVEDYPLVIPPALNLKCNRIIQYTLDGELVKVWESSNKAGNHFSCKGEVLDRHTQLRTPIKGFQWRKYIDEYPNSIDNYINPSIILQIDKDGIVIKEWECQVDISAAGYNNISKALKSGRKVKEFSWIYKKDYNKKLDCDIVQI